MSRLITWFSTSRDAEHICHPGARLEIGGGRHFAHKRHKRRLFRGFGW